MLAVTATALDLGEQDAGPCRADVDALRGAPKLGDRVLRSVSGLGQAGPEPPPPDRGGDRAGGLRGLSSNLALTVTRPGHGLRLSWARVGA